MKNAIRLFLDLGVPIILGAMLFFYWQYPFKRLPNKVVGIYAESFKTNKKNSVKSNFSKGELNETNKRIENNPAETGPIGDTFGGTLGPIIAMGAAYLTFIAFWVQFRANSQQRKDMEIERFENRFYELLNFHRYNLEEMNIDNKFTGRKCFVRMFYEFQFIYLTVYHIAINNKDDLKREYSKSELCDIAYKVFFFGVGSVSDNVINKLIKKEDHSLLNLLRGQLQNIQKDFQASSIFGGKEYLERVVLTEDNKSIFNFEIFYYPFDGHSTRLGHYYRHLFQSVKFVAESKTINERKSKYDYIKILRSMMSNHELLLLYYNSLSTFGQEWIKNGYFTDFRFIKNIPMQYATFGVLPKERLKYETKTGVYETDNVLYNKSKEIIFEWEEPLHGKI